MFGFARALFFTMRCCICPIRSFLLLSSIQVMILQPWSPSRRCFDHFIGVPQYRELHGNTRHLQGRHASHDYSSSGHPAMRGTPPIRRANNDMSDFQDRIAAPLALGELPTRSLCPRKILLRPVSVQRLQLQISRHRIPPLAGISFLFTSFAVIPSSSCTREASRLYHIGAVSYQL